MNIPHSILTLLAGIGVFLASISMLSASLNKNFGHRMRGLFKKVGTNRFAGVAIGTGVTGVIQSSTAVTVMTVGLVNIGVLTLFQATSIIMGANIGTTFTNFLVALETLEIYGNEFQIKYVFMALAGIGVIMKMAFKKEKIHTIGELLIYIGLLFIGLNLMSSAFNNNTVKEFFSGNPDQNKVGLFEKVNFPLLLILLGALFTAIIQSSTASMAIYLIMVGTGAMPVHVALFLILGTEFGTCSTALFSSIGTNANAKRAALTHFFYNIFGTIFFAAILWPLYAYTNVVGSLEAALGKVWLVALFPLVNNITSVAILVWFIKPFNKLICKMVKEKESEEDKVRNSLRDENLFKTPTLAIEKALTEVYNMTALARENFDRAFNALVDVDMSRSKEIANCEYKIDFMTAELSSYFVRASTAALSPQDAKLIGGLHHVINSVERIGDYAVTFAKETNCMKQLGLTFLDESKDELKTVYARLSELFELGLETFKTRKTDHFERISDLHQEISALIMSVRNAHIERFSSNMYNVEVSKSLYAAFSSLQRVSDHILNIAYSIRSHTGNKTEALESLKRKS